MKHFDNTPSLLTSPLRTFSERIFPSKLLLLSPSALLRRKPCAPATASHHSLVGGCSRRRGGAGAAGGGRHPRRPTCRGRRQGSPPHRGARRRRPRLQGPLPTLGSFTVDEVQWRRSLMHILLNIRLRKHTAAP
uniref:Uncharacterized protein n=1 Tax=Setaria viridis TaxID=4556 RepID=A0A4U6UUL6_SETVI|nr:hypothetical protein SEVIR_5G194000v2 [Setaria viridis]